MGHLKIILDHEKIDYSGLLQLNDLFKTIENFLFERGFDKKQDKDFEQKTPTGKCLEWQISPWKKISDYVRYIIKIRVLGYDIINTESVTDPKSGKKIKIDKGRVIIVIDGFIENDYDNKWDERPFLLFLRTIYDYFIFKVYTERFEQMLIHDINHLTDNLEKFFNVYRNYSVISSKAP